MKSSTCFAFVIVSVCLGACSSPGGAGSHCNASGDCASGLVCSANVCSVPDDEGTDVAPADARDAVSDGPAEAAAWDDGGMSTFNGCGPGDFVDRTAASANHTVVFGGDAGFAYSPRCLWVADGTMVTFQGDFTLHPLVPGDAPSRAGMDAPGTTPNPIPMTTTGTFVTVNFPTGVEGIYTFYCGNHQGSGMYGAILVR